MKNKLIILFCILCSCSAFRHSLPYQANLFVTKDQICERQPVTIEYKQDIFGSKIRLKYQDKTDTLDIRKLFRRYNANTYSNGEYTVVIGIDHILTIDHNGRKIVVDYRCAQ